VEIIGLAKKVSIYIGESDRWGHKPLYAAILELLKRENCAGATVTRALAGFGTHSRIHTASLVALSSDLPLVIEWVDSPARVGRVMPRLREMIVEGLITIHDVEVITYSHRGLRELPAEASVRDVMSREVHTVRGDTRLAEAVELLVDKAYRTLPVTDAENRIVGILTDGDLLNRADLLAPSVQRKLTDAELRQHLSELRHKDVNVEQVMTTPVVTVSETASVADAVRRMAELDLKRLPVVDEEGHLVGIVSRVDVLRALAQPPVAEVPRRSPVAGSDAVVGDVMMTSVPSVKADASLAEVVDLLVSTAQRRVVVVDDEHQVVGIITDGDLLERASDSERVGILESLTQRVPAGRHAGFQLRQRTAREVMTPRPVCVHPDTPLLAALNLLLEHHIKRLPVVDEASQLVGLLGRGGVLQVLGRELKP
jgi:CBS-domain-containing membrane protein